MALIVFPRRHQNSDPKKRLPTENLKIVCRKNTSKYFCGENYTVCKV
jgi:hypothetical protein